MSDIKPPRTWPTTHYVGLAIPMDFAKVVIEAAAKNNTLFEDQLLTWAQMGAEHARLCGPKTTRTGRKK